LNDPREQRRRLENEQQQRRWSGADAHPIDERFLDALEIGMPPSGGVALGVDRLVMILANKEKVSDVLAFPFSHDFPPRLTE
jgi:lysyl-tRNA synthetase class 2